MTLHMADKNVPELATGSQAVDLGSEAPLAPRTYAGEAVGMSSYRTVKPVETPRQAKRRRWQEDKIKLLRQKCYNCRRDKQKCERTGEDADCVRCLKFGYSCSIDDLSQGRDEDSQSRRKLNLVKCTQCRADKKKCTPLERRWPGEKCERCLVKDLPCSEGIKSSIQIPETPQGPIRRNTSADPLSISDDVSVTSSQLNNVLDTPWSALSNFWDAPWPALSKDTNESGCAPYQYRALKTLVQNGLTKEDIRSMYRLGFDGIRRILKVLEKEGDEGMHSLLNALERIDQSVLEASLEQVAPANSTGFGHVHSGASVPSTMASSSGTLNSNESRSVDTRGSRRGRRRWMRTTDSGQDNFAQPRSHPLCCTFASCGASFGHRYEWVRHEESVHWQSVQWICMPNGPVVEGGKCAFCAEESPDVAHLQLHHVSVCLEKPLEERTFFRKDQLLQHIKHHHLEADTLRSYKVPDAWEQERDPTSLEEVWCGFCQQTFHTTKQRMLHVYQHFVDGLDMRSWRGPTTRPNLDEGPADTIIDLDLHEQRSKEDSSLSSENKTRRSKISSQEKTVLEASFWCNPYPSKPEIDKLSATMSLDAKTIRTWFNNSRSRRRFASSVAEREPEREPSTNPSMSSLDRYLASSNDIPEPTSLQRLIEGNDRSQSLTLFD